MGSGSTFFTRSDSSILVMDSQQTEEKWVIHIKNALEDAKCSEFLASGPSIFMASSPLRGVKHEAFIPQVVAIGPYHSDLGPHHSSFPENQETDRYKAIAAKEMLKHKVMALKHVERTFKSRDFVTLAEEIMKLIHRVREEYDTELVSCKVDEKLGYMLALDAAFVVEVLRSNAGSKDINSGFHSYYIGRFPTPLRKSILQDFVLLENQIPLFVLLKVIKMDKECVSDDRAEKVLGQLVTKVAREVLPFNLSADSISSIVSKIGERKHLLDCLYRIVTYKGSGGGGGAGTTEESPLVEKPTHFPAAVDLHNSGITFRAVEPSNLMSVGYDEKRAILDVPKIRVGDDTERLFRNLIAYESHLVDDVHVLSYLRFMNSLVDTSEDVALLVDRGVIAQDIGSNDEVASMWNNLCVNTMRVCSPEYELVAKQLLKHCQYKPNAWKAEFKRTYLSRPWLIVSVLSAASLLIMSFVIMIYTIWLYYKKPGG